MAWNFAVTVPIPCTWGGHLPPGAVQKKPDTNGLDPIKNAEIRIKKELSKKISVSWRP